MDSDNDQRAIEQEFLESWDFTEQTYLRFIASRWDHYNSLLNVISKLRSQGYDRRLRAGTSLASFILSRSRKHGLGSDQSSLTFNLHAEGGMTVSYFEAPDVRIHVVVEQVSITPEVEELLTRLLSHPID